MEETLSRFRREQEEKLDGGSANVRSLSLLGKLRCAICFSDGFFLFLLPLLY
jgi:hypothetical protein